MATDMKLDPAPIMQISTGPWANAILAAAVEHRVFVHLEGGPLPADALATKAGISPRGAQALLDGLLGLSLAEKEGDRYRNSALASAFLVDGKPTFLGGLSRVNLAEGPRRALLPQAVRTGVPAVDETTDLKENPFWELLVPAIAGLAAPVAQLAAEKLGVARAGAISVLDVGGGSGIYAIVWGRINPHAASLSSTGGTSIGSPATSRERPASPIASRRSTAISTRPTSGPRATTSRSIRTSPIRSRRATTPPSSGSSERP
jgi:hypothetical protein